MGDNIQTRAEAEASKAALEAVVAKSWTVEVDRVRRGYKQDDSYKVVARSNQGILSIVAAADDGLFYVYFDDGAGVVGRVKAGTMQVGFKTAAEAWAALVERINERYHRAVKQYAAIHE